MSKLQTSVILIVLILVFLFSTRVCYANQITECNFLYKLTSPDPQYRGLFGSSCVIYNNTIAIGESGLYGGSEPGKVHFFNLNGSLVKSIKSPLSGNQSYFGYAITKCHNLLLIGDPGITVEGIKSAGMVHVYLDGEYVKTITSTQPSLNGEFGRSLASNGKLILIGEPGPQILDENVTSRVHVYNKKCEYQYTIQQSEARAGCFGMSIALNNETIIIGEPYLSEGRHGWQGIAYLYDLNGKLIRNITSPLHTSTIYPRNFGYRISANDNMIAIGEVRGSVDELDAAGRAYIFDRKGNFLTNLTSLKPTGYANFGYLLVWRDLILVEDYVRVENFTDRIGAVIYDKLGNIQAVVSSRDYEWARGYPKAFNDEFIILGDISGSSSGVEYAGNVYVMRVPQEIWDMNNDFQNRSVSIWVLILPFIVLLLLLYRRLYTYYF